MNTTTANVEIIKKGMVDNKNLIGDITNHLYGSNHFGNEAKISYEICHLTYEDESYNDYYCVRFYFYDDSSEREIYEITCNNNTPMEIIEKFTSMSEKEMIDEYESEDDFIEEVLEGYSAYAYAYIIISGFVIAIEHSFGYPTTTSECFVHMGEDLSNVISVYSDNTIDICSKNYNLLRAHCKNVAIATRNEE